MLESILEQNSPFQHLGNELRLLKDQIYCKFRKEAAPIYDPDRFKELCIASGAPNIFRSIYQMMSAPRRNARRNKDIEKLTVNIIYTLCYGLSQKCNFMQKDLSLFLMSENHFVQQIPSRRPVGLLINGHLSHVDYNTSLFCSHNPILLFRLPPHTSHVMQLADRWFFNVFKGEWKKACT